MDPEEERKIARKAVHEAMKKDPEILELTAKIIASLVKTDFDQSHSETMRLRGELAEKLKTKGLPWFADQLTRNR